MRWDRHSLTAIGGIAALLIGAGLLLAEARAAFAPVLGMIAGIATVTAANHERLKQRIGKLEQRLGQAEWGRAKRRQP